MAGQTEGGTAMKVTVADIFNELMLTGTMRIKDPFRIVITVDG